MATLNDLQAALVAADAAGNTEDATQLAQAIVQMQGQPQQPPNAAPQKGTGSGFMDGLSALASGANQGLARLAGLPMDTARNIVDLGKAAIGAPYIAATGKVPPEWLQVGDRSEVPLTGDNLIKNLPAKMMRAANPDDEGGYLQAIGSAIPGVLAQRPIDPKIATSGVLQTLAKNGGMAAASAVAGKAAGDASGDPALAIAASMAPVGLAGMRRPSVRPPSTPTSDALGMGRAQGYVVPPSQAGAGWLNNRLESIAGKSALKQDATLRNQQITNRLAAQSVGLDPSEPITRDALQQLRDAAGKSGYAPLSSVPVFNSTLGYQDALDAINQKYGQPNSTVTALRNPDVSTLTSDLNKTQLTGQQVNDLIKNLREGGNSKVASSYGAANGDQTRNFGKAMIGSSGALEDLVSENLQGTPQAGLIPALLDARTNIARTYTVEKALNPATGDVNAGALSKAWKKGKPLSDEQEKIGQFAAAFPQFTGNGASTPTPGVSALEAFAVPALAAAGHAATGGVAGSAAGLLPMLRSPARNLLLSKWYERNFAQRPDVAGPRAGVSVNDLQNLILGNLADGTYQP